METIKINKRYRIIEKIGEGGSSVVYKGYDLIGQHYVAIKLLKGIIGEPSYEKNKYRLMTESQFLSSFNSNNIVSLKSWYFAEDRNAYIVLEYIEGMNLKKYIKSKSIGQLEALYIMNEIAKALIAIHRKHLIHRDLKPQNIIMTNTKNVKLLDFGIMLNQQDSFHLTTENKVIGSIQYMAPELLSTKYSFSIASDIYALGIIMFEILIGELPFTSKNIDIIAEKHASGSIPIIYKINSDLSPKLQKIIEKACSKKAENRYQRVEDFQKDIIEVYNMIKLNRGKSKNILTSVFRRRNG